MFSVRAKYISFCFIYSFFGGVFSAVFVFFLCVFLFFFPFFCFFFPNPPKKAQFPTQKDKLGGAPGEAGVLGGGMPRSLFFRVFFFLFSSFQCFFFFFFRVFFGFSGEISVMFFFFLAF